MSKNRVFNLPAIDIDRLITAVDAIQDGSVPRSTCKYCHYGDLYWVEKRLLTVTGRLHLCKAFRHSKRRKPSTNSVSSRAS